MWNESRYEWVRMPSAWILQQGGTSLRDFTVGDKGASIAALMIYIMLCTRALQKSTEEFEAGTARVTYDDIEKAIGLSRAMISKGLSKLENLKLIAVIPYRRQNVYELTAHTESPWAKLPKKHLYQKKATGEIDVFLNDFHLRSRTELNALKLYMLLLAFRDRDSNTTFLGYQAISDYSGIQRNDIRKAISFLIHHDFIQLDKVMQEGTDIRVNRYEIKGLSHLHPGNRSS